MKINEVTESLNEGPMDFLKKAYGFVKGGVPGWQAVAQQQQGQDLAQKVFNNVKNDWNQYIVNLPPNVPDPNQVITDFANKKFHETGQSQLVPNLSNIKDVKNANDYIYKRAQEYLAKKTVMPAQQSPSKMGQGYAPPPTNAQIVSPDTGWQYQYIKKTDTWIKLPEKTVMDDEKDRQSLNKLYLRLNPPSQPQPKHLRQPRTQAQQPITIGGQTINPGDPTYQAVLNQIKQQQRASKPSPTPKTTPPGTTPVRESVLSEGGKAIKGAQPILKEDVPRVVELAKKALPAELLKGLQADIGSAGYKIKSGDIDLMVEAEDVVKLFNTTQLPDSIGTARKMLRDHFLAQGIDSNVVGRNVEIGIVYQQQSTGKKVIGQVDVMVIADAAIVAPYHQHGPRGMYDDPDFKGNEIFILKSSIAKHLGLKFDPFGAKLIRRDTGDVVGRTRKEVAKILLNPRAKDSDLNSVSTILRALENDPDREGKLAQARQDAGKGLLRLPESAPFNTAAYFKKLSEIGV